MIDIGVLNWILNKFARTKSGSKGDIATGRASSVGGNFFTSFRRSRSQDLLKELRSIPDEADAIEFIVKKTPDASMGAWNFIRLANQGHQMKFYAVGDEKKETSLEKIEQKWRDFASGINLISNSGLDGLIDIIHKYGVLYGNQMLEVEVNQERTEVVEVHPIDPRTIVWEWETRNGKKMPIPYQYDEGGQKVDLSKANVFYVPLDPDGNDPTGTLIMAPALQAIDSQLQVFNDVHAVLHHQGYGRDFYSINLERTLQMCPSHIRNNPKELNKWLNEHHAEIVKSLQSIEPDSDIVSYDDVTRDKTSNAGVARSVDFRAINEMTDIQTLNGLKQLSTFANRHTGRTETYASVEYLIVTQGIKSLQRGSKRLMEEVARLWLRVNGIQAIPKFTHNTIDYVSELQRMDIRLKDVELYAKAQACGWISPDRAAQEAMGEKKAYAQVPPEEISVSFGSGGVNFGDNDKHERQTGGEREYQDRAPLRRVP